ncbi:nucleoid occlusion factor SlmA [Alcanivorax sp. HI0083]|uniref:nucleoid occlusion factor SlmA n=1 Tax=unclassified Alcanivorax TaxID=2638842 RepID=UPI0007B843F0|nr:MULTISPECIES: nucleoid occlusion factor SlmA [unclassified Alcanivorax]KZY28515.1 nucleoid occlusion factor SlmA [Alcanivorax sp. HI0044]KZZ27455.1 nucleoid occlusion factor SlmA [Alcanivorax sp. HI0083]PHR68095.1 MAG: nucleoid occlusion factor SlmA [Alcanivorax sp.]
MTDKKPSRKEQILQSLAHMLEAAPGGRITTAGLAKEVGVSEAALYRHFPSKAKMFEGLISFIEEAIFSRINRIMEDGKASDQVEQILTLLLAFTERNPGITRLLTGDALTGENARLHQRIQQFYDRVESQLKQVLRDAEFKEGLRTQATPTITANLLLAVAEGRIAQFVRSGFRIKPSQDWPAQWALLQPTLFR